MFAKHLHPRWVTREIADGSISGYFADRGSWRNFTLTRYSLNRNNRSNGTNSRTLLSIPAPIGNARTRRRFLHLLRLCKTHSTGDV